MQDNCRKPCGNFSCFRLLAILSYIVDQLSFLLNYKLLTIYQIEGGGVAVSCGLSSLENELFINVKTKLMDGWSLCLSSSCFYQCPRKTNLNGLECLLNNVFHAKIHSVLSSIFMFILSSVGTSVVWLILPVIQRKYLIKQWL